jgi:DNA-binding NarL/FixJ family response regulator
MPVRLVIVDGHTLLRYGLRELLSQEPDIEVVGECASAADAAKTVTVTRPDVVTCDVALPDEDGLALARRLRDTNPELGVVVLASHNTDALLFRAAESGASAFVAKAAPAGEVLTAIRHAVVAPGSFSSSGLAAALARRRRAADSLALSARETEVLHLLGDGMSVPAISLAMCISHSTAKTYVARLYDKLGATNRAQVIMTAVRLGLLGHGQSASPNVAFIPAQGAAARRPRRPARPPGTVAVAS